jgi:glycine cleavage system H protein
VRTYINYWGKKLTFPEELLYTPELLWVKIEPGETLRIGISDLGVKAVKELLYVRIKSRAGNQLKKGDLIGTVETSKMVWQIIAPVSGVVVAVNDKLLAGNPAVIEHDPYGEGWILQLQKTSETTRELSQLMPGSDEKTKQWIAERIEATIPLQMT